MANSWVHAMSSARRFGGTPEDYHAIHHWFDDTKSAYADQRHRAIKHHSHGIFECERVFGPALTNSDGKTIPTRLVAEQHVIEDLGFIPTIKEWLEGLPLTNWMRRGTLPLAKILENHQETLKLVLEPLPSEQLAPTEVTHDRSE